MQACNRWKMPYKNLIINKEANNGNFRQKKALGNYLQDKGNQ